jgi:hypothetical protein
LTNGTGVARHLFIENFKGAHSVGLRLKLSIERLSPIFPLLIRDLEELTVEQEESLDAFLHRFNSLFSMIQDHLFRGVALLEQEDISGKSNRDRTLLMEKLGTIESANQFAGLAELRNRLARHYPNEREKQIERLNLAIPGAKALLEVLDGIRDYAMAKKLADLSGFEPLAS